MYENFPFSTIEHIESPQNSHRITINLMGAVENIKYMKKKYHQNFLRLFFFNAKGPLCKQCFYKYQFSFPCV